MSATKTCAKCGDCKGLGEFHCDKRNPDGRSGCCKVCACQRARHWHASHRESAIERSKRWALENKDAALKRSRDWAQANEQKALAANNRYRKRNPIKVREFTSRARDGLTDGYVRRVLRAHNNTQRRIEIPQPLIEAKRLELKIKRLLKHKKDQQQ